MSRAGKLIKDRSGAGAMIWHRDETLLLLRGGNVRHSQTWAPPGGRIDPGEAKNEAALRETMEEVGIDLSNFYSVDIFTQPLTDDEPGTYTTFVYLYPDPAERPEVILDYNESDDYGWFGWEDMMKLPLHPGMYLLLEHLRRHD